MLEAFGNEIGRGRSERLSCGSAQWWDSPTGLPAGPGSSLHRQTCRSAKHIQLEDRSGWANIQGLRERHDQLRNFDPCTLTSCTILTHLTSNEIVICIIRTKKKPLTANQYSLAGCCWLRCVSHLNFECLKGSPWLNRR